ncbi:MAG: lamin tail domain-containing protein [Bacteroidales bacterium]|nr:lamin tail domain-containing protein [Bacteroidales bacterium]
MKKYYMMACALFAAFAMVACTVDDDDIRKDDNNQNQEQNNGENNGENQEGNNGEQTNDDQMTTICFNEVCGVVGSKGIELYNPTDNEVSLEGVAIYKNEAADPTWTGDADAKIASKGYFVITSKKEFDDIKDVANAKAADSFSPSKSLTLALKDKDGNVLDVFDRGWEKNGKAEVALPTAEGSFARTSDAKKEWKVLAITMGKTNNGAAVLGEIIEDPE